MKKIVKADKLFKIEDGKIAYGVKIYQREKKSAVPKRGIIT